jgi:hypothetical protein
MGTSSCFVKIKTRVVGGFLTMASLILLAGLAGSAHANELNFVAAPPDKPLDGARPDMQDQLQAAFDRAALSGQTVVLPSGKFYHSGTLKLRGVRVRGSGDATILEGTTRDSASIIVTGSGAGLSDLALTFKATTRSQADTSALVLVQHATGFAVSNLLLDGSDSAGILISGSSHGDVRRNRIYNTLADSIHITAASSNIVVHDNAIEFSGDDGIAVVSYERSGLASDIAIVGNSVVDNRYARGISVVGGRGVRVAENSVRCKAGYAGIYVASERSYATYGSEDVIIERNSVSGCGGAKVGHGAITVFSDYNANRKIWIKENRISSSPAVGIFVLWGPNVDLALENNAIAGSGDADIKLFHQKQPVVVSGNTRAGGGPASTRLIATEASVLRERRR